MKFHEYREFISLSCDSMNGTKWFHTIISCRFHAWNCMESYGSMHEIVWNHIIVAMKSGWIIWKTKETTVMTSENIENNKIRSKTTGRTSRIRAKITERTTGTRSKKKRKSHPKRSDSVLNCKHSLQKLKTEVFILKFWRHSASETERSHMTGPTTRTWPPLGPKAESKTKIHEQKWENNYKVTNF